MNPPTTLNDQHQPLGTPKAAPGGHQHSATQDRLQQFRAAIAPIVYRARQLGLNRVQIREIITSLL